MNYNPLVILISRGEESKIVESGAKYYNILIAGISFIEKLSFTSKGVTEMIKSKMRARKNRLE